MTDAHVQDLKSTLSSMFEAIEKKEPIAGHLTRLDALQRDIADSAPAQLRHFLERRSYAKALEFLENGVVIDDPNRPECEDEPNHP